MFADGRVPVGRGPYPPLGRQGARRRWDRRLTARTLKRGQVPASPARARLPAAVHVAALDYQDAPDVGTARLWAAWRTPSDGRPGAVAGSRAGEAFLWPVQASKPEPLDSAPLWRHVANRRLQLLRWLTRCRLPRTDHPYDSCRSPAWQTESTAIAINRRISSPIRQFLPDGGRHLGLGSNGCRNPILRHAGVLLNGARRIRTADLLGAIQALCQLSYSPGLCGGWEVGPTASQATG
jgi:hypothetical protein